MSAIVLHFLKTIFPFPPSLFLLSSKMPLEIFSLSLMFISFTIKPRVNFFLFFLFGVHAICSFSSANISKIAFFPLLLFFSKYSYVKSSPCIQYTSCPVTYLLSLYLSVLYSEDVLLAYVLVYYSFLWDIWKWEYRNLKSFHRRKETVNKMKWQRMKWKKIFSIISLIRG